MLRFVLAIKVGGMRARRASRAERLYSQYGSMAPITEYFLDHAVTLLGAMEGCSTWVTVHSNASTESISIDMVNQRRPKLTLHDMLGIEWQDDNLKSQPRSPKVRRQRFQQLSDDDFKSQPRPLKAKHQHFQQLSDSRPHHRPATQTPACHTWLA